MSPELVSYDAHGAEIDRRPLFLAEDQLEHCYAGPDRKRIYGKPTSGCRPAENVETERQYGTSARLAATDGLPTVAPRPTWRPAD